MQKKLLVTMISAALAGISFNAQADSHEPVFNVSGLAEVALASTDEDDGKTDLYLDAVELTVDGTVNEFISFSTTLKYEDDPDSDSDFNVDEAIVTLGEEDGNVSLTLGMTGIPFGVIDGSTWTGPLTDDFSDNTDDIAILTFGAGAFGIEAYAFKADQENDDNIENFGANIGFEQDGLVLGAGFLNNIGNTEAFGQTEKSAAFRINASYTMGDIMVSAEHLQASKFDDLNGAKPSASHIALDVGTDVIGAPGVIALGYSTTDDAESMDLGESLLVTSVSRELGDNAETILEFTREEPYGNGDAVNTVNLVLSASF